MKTKSKNQISYNMRCVKSTDSKIEITLRKELWSRGLRYRKNVNTIFGKPDIVFISNKVAIFCDGEFWHGHNWEQSKKDFRTNSDFWIKKIENNIKRDKLVNETLESQNWKVLRFWGKNILKNPAECADQIERLLKN